MRVSRELNLESFEFWSGAKDHNFTYTELRNIEYNLEDLFPDGATETDINDMFWFEEEFLCECIGVDYEEDYLTRD
jgi:hypothetical protein